MPFTNCSFQHWECTCVGEGEQCKDYSINAETPNFANRSAATYRVTLVVTVDLPAPRWLRAFKPSASAAPACLPADSRLRLSK